MYQLRIISVFFLVVVQATMGLGTDVLHRWLHRGCEHVASSDGCSTDNHCSHSHSHDASQHGVIHHGVTHHHASHTHSHAACTTSDECSSRCDESQDAAETSTEDWSTQSHDHDSCWVCRQLSRPMTWVEPVIVAVSTELVSVLNVESASLCAISVARNYDSRGPPSLASLSA